MNIINEAGLAWLIKSFFGVGLTFLGIGLLTMSSVTGKSFVIVGALTLVITTLIKMRMQKGKD